MRIRFNKFGIYFNLQLLEEFEYPDMFSFEFGVGRKCYNVSFCKIL